jgi:2-dehydro-3-deoxygluconokinase
MQRGAKVVYDRAYSSMTTITPGQINWDAALKDVDWFHWTGVTPGLSQSAADACLEACKAASDRGITISSDPNYRKALWKYGKSPVEVLPALVEYSDIVISSKFDAETLFGIPFKEDSFLNKNLDTPPNYSIIGEAVMERFPKVKKVISTSRGSISASHNTWSAMLWDGKEVHTSPAYELSHIVDRVGGGDSFMAGLIYGFLTWPEDDTMALRYAVAASALKHSISGDTNLATVNEVMNLLNGDGSGRVSR